MAKKRTQKKRNNGTGGRGNGDYSTKYTPTNKPKRPVKAMVPAYNMDAAAMEYARLLNDPCNANLVRGVGVSSDGAVLVRLESDHVMFTGGAETGGVMYWVPGMVRAFSAPAATDTVGLTLADNSANIVPGWTFLAAYSSVRCLAACVQASYPGAELNRSGVVSLGIVPAQLMGSQLPVAYGGSAGNTNVASVRSMSQFVSRTPAETVEIKFRPGPGDAELVDMIAIGTTPADFPAEARGKNAFLCSASGLPAGIGIRVRTIAVYAVEPKAGQGMVASVQTNASRSTTQDVLGYLDKKDPKWWLEATSTVISMGSMLAAALI
jgi:hypothetical protein